jgi:hypothetical protein
MNGPKRRGWAAGFGAAAVALAASVVLSAGCSGGSTSTTSDGGSCGANSTLCGGSCVSLQTDNANCGACGTACSAGEVCSQGKCGTSCGGGTTLCGTSCADTKNDPNHCGGCGTKCSAGQVCSNGSCGTTCGTDQTFCGGDGGTPYCASTKTDNANCGGCGVTCGTGQVCVDSACSNSCGGDSDAGTEGGPETLCKPDGGTPYCANTQSDNANCGGCGVTCAAQEVCSGGHCQSSCVQGQTLCTPDGGAPYCASTQTDSQNCNACGNVCPGATNATAGCSAGACTFACNAGYADCNLVAADGCESTLATDANNCGVCGQVCASGQCANAKCVLSGKTGPSWQTLANQPAGYMYNLEDYIPTWGALVYGAMGGGAMYSYDPLHNTFSAALASVTNYQIWNSLVPDGNFIYVIAKGEVDKYDITNNSWSQVLTSVVNNDYSLAAKDDSGVIWSVTDEAPPRILKYDIASNTVSYVASGLGNGYSEFRVAWDPATNKLFIGPYYSTGEFHAFDIATSTLTNLTAQPESYMNDIFCSDHSGHIYAGGNPSSPNTMWQYTIATDKWAQIPNLPFAKGNNGACVVSTDGWLYVSNGSTGNLARISLE